VPKPNNAIVVGSGIYTASILVKISYSANFSLPDSSTSGVLLERLYLIRSESPKLNPPINQYSSVDSVQHSILSE